MQNQAEAMNTNQSLAVVNDQSAMLEMIERLATNPDVDVEKMRQILEMKTAIFDKGAEIEFNRAMSLAQSEMKPIAKDAENTHTRSNYALLETICAAITPVYTKHGFSLSFSEEDCPKRITSE